MHPHANLPAGPRSTPPIAWTVTASSESQLVQAVLDRAIVLASGNLLASAAPPTLIGFRSIATGIADLLAAVVEDAFGEAEAQGTRVVAAEVSGVMPVDDGVRCWGFVSVVPASTGAAVAVPRLEELSVVENPAGEFTATMTVSVGGGGA